ncbi:glutaminyl-tRNA synthase (glutamine-hydrolysing) [Powellomyces hirtus]|uniref:Glutamyl-tRNA(Gln) amidotransferase subunit A, mitochondrial n=1 Tax=Powellomyces hirtus TaxID=109895 RepID=A0A507E287_9FUNG|nr:glutaminyl-tRNA synthase (glutamine-hydrolysing) [Powellomyces hirtus]
MPKLRLIRRCVHSQYASSPKTCRRTHTAAAQLNCKSSLAESVARLRSGTTSPAKLLSICLDAISARNSNINALIHVASTTDLRANATAAEERWKTHNQRGPLDGIPIAIKHNICTRDLATTCGSKMLEGFLSPNDATVVKLLRDRGAIIVGKTNMDEFGMGSANIHSFHGPTQNPVIPDADHESNGRVAGGSSGGSAAAVAAGMCFAALGSDTGGSVRTPAAYTGVVGFKPSYGRLSRFGLVSYASSLDTVGILARRVPDVKLVYDTLAHYDELDSTSVALKSTPVPPLEDLTGLRIGVPQEYHVEGLSEAVLESWSAAADFLASRGATVVPVSLPHTQQAIPAYYVIAPAEASSNLAKYDGVRYGHRSSAPRDQAAPLYATSRTEGFGAEVLRRIMLGTFVLQANSYTSYYQQAQKLRRLVQRDFDNVFAMTNPLHAAATGNTTSAGQQDPSRSSAGSGNTHKVDLLLTPSATSAAPRVADYMTSSSQTPVNECINDVMTVPASLAGLPALAIPFGHDAEGLPVGIQLLGQYGDDQRVLAVGSIVEKGQPPKRVT